MTHSILYIIILVLILIILLMIFKLFKSRPHNHPIPQIKSPVTEVPLHQNQIELTGVVTDYAVNHIDDVDKIILDCHTEKIAVHFPPHIGKQITRNINKGNKITVIVHPSRKKMYTHYPIYDLIAIKNASSSLTLNNTPPPPSAGIPIEITGTISAFKYNKENFVSGFIINGYLVDIPPHFGEIMTSVLKKEKEINLRGYKRNKNNDFINQSGYEIIRPYCISIDQTDYLL